MATREVERATACTSVYDAIACALLDPVEDAMRAAILPEAWREGWWRLWDPVEVAVDALAGYPARDTVWGLAVDIALAENY